MTTQHEKAEAFAALDARDRAFIIPNPWDIGTARILAQLGFEALATTSAGFAGTLGRTDGSVTRDEAVSHARDIALATPLPVSADLENGFGDDPATVGETIRLSARAGLVGGSIEGWKMRNLKVFLSSPFVSQKLRMFVSMPNSADLQLLKELAENGTITPVIDRTYPLDETHAAFSHVGEAHARGQTIVTM